MSTTPVTFIQTPVPGAEGSLPLTVQFEGNKGAVPLITDLAEAPFNEQPIAPIVRTQPFVALTPNEIELNRELAYIANNPVLANK